MYLNMFFKTIGCVSDILYINHKSQCSHESVCFHVCYKVIILYESLITLVTLILFICENLINPGKITISCKSFSTEIALIWLMCVNLIKPGKIIISCKIFSTVITWIWLIICVDFLIQLPGIFTIFFKSLGRFSKRIYLKINFRWKYKCSFDSDAGGGFFSQIKFF